MKRILDFVVTLAAILASGYFAMLAWVGSGFSNPSFESSWRFLIYEFLPFLYLPCCVFSIWKKKQAVIAASVLTIIYSLSRPQWSTWTPLSCSVGITLLLVCKAILSKQIHSAQAHAFPRD